MKRMFAIALFLVVLAGGAGLAQAPPAPLNLTARPAPGAGVILEWDSSAGAGYYRIYKSNDGSPFFAIGATEHRGFIDWMIEPLHRYHYFVRAFALDLGSDPGDTVSFSTFPDHPLGPHGVVMGTVTDDSTGLPVPDALVKFSRANGLWDVRTHTDSGGSYEVALDTGRYYIRTEKPGYVPEWFDNALTIVGASVVPVHEDTTTANVGLRPLPHPLFVNVSGVVRDSSSGLPVQNALVAFMRPFAAERALEHELGFFGGFPWEHVDLPGFGPFSGVIWFGLTDTAGRYNAHVLAGFRQIALAFKPGYELKFYQDKRSPFDADRIVAEHDTSGIDFNLALNPLAFLSMTGTVHDTSNIGVVSHVVLIRLTAFGPRLVRYRTTDSLGNYSFNNLAPGNFVVRAIPRDFYAPAWYNAAACGVSNWHGADTIHLTGSRAGVDICVMPLGPDGFGEISGLINGPGNIAGSSSVQGVTVYAVSNSTNRIVGYDVTEDDGSFTIDGLTAGTYHLVADKEGYSPVSSPSVSVGPGNNYASGGNSITVTQDALTSVPVVPAGLPAAYRLGQNYPNPFNPSTTVKFELPKQSAVTIKVYNLIGQEIAELANAVYAAGTFSARWDGTDRSGVHVGSGIYFLKLTAVSQEKNGVSFTQTRKIMLLK